MLYELSTLVVLMYDTLLDVSRNSTYGYDRKRKKLLNRDC